MLVVDPNRSTNKTSPACSSRRGRYPPRTCLYVQSPGCQPRDCGAGSVPEGSADQRRPVRHANPVFAVRQLVLLDPLTQALARAALRARPAMGGEPTTRERHVDDPEQQNRQAERREAEEPEPCRATPHE